MALLPTPRTNLKSISSKNQSLQDILKSCSRAFEVLSVEVHLGGIHNTKITLEVDIGEEYPPEQRYQKRVHFYNRLPLNQVIPSDASYPTSNITAAIEVLNREYGCDFTTDDLELVGGNVSAKATSLGYYNDGGGEGGDCRCVMDSQAAYFNDTYVNMGIYDPSTGEAWIAFQEVKLNLLVNGTVYTKTFTSEGLLENFISQIMNENDLYGKLSFSLSSAGQPNLYVQNLTSECGSFGFYLEGKTSGGVTHSMDRLHLGDMELCPNGERKIICAGLAAAVHLHGLGATAPEGEYQTTINGITYTMSTLELRAHFTKYGLPSPPSLTYELIFMGIVEMAGAVPFFSISNQSQGASPLLTNVTEDCVSLNLKYTGSPERTIFDFILGTNTDLIGNVDVLDQF